MEEVKPYETKKNTKSEEDKELFLIKKKIIIKK